METQTREAQRSDPAVVGLRKMSPRVTGSMIRIRDEAYSDGTLPAKHKILTALAISVIIKCEPCIEMYVSKARELGATRQEIVEILNVTIAMGGCPGEAWAYKALGAYERAGDGPAEAGGGEEAGHSCCP